MSAPSPPFRVLHTARGCSRTPPRVGGDGPEGGVGARPTMRGGAAAQNGQAGGRGRAPNKARWEMRPRRAARCRPGRPRGPVGRSSGGGGPCSLTPAGDYISLHAGSTPAGGADQLRLRATEQAGHGGSRCLITALYHAAATGGGTGADLLRIRAGLPSARLPSWHPRRPPCAYTVAACSSAARGSCVIPFAAGAAGCL